MTPPWYRKAMYYVGQKEVPGKGSNPVVLGFFKRIFFPVSDDAVPWCAAFVGSCLEECGIKSTRKPAALSYSTYGEKLPWPTLGAIGYKERRNSAGKLVGGHVFFIAGETADGHIMALGGNQNDEVCVEPINRSVILGYRWPPGSPLPSASELPQYPAVGKTTLVKES